MAIVYGLVNWGNKLYLLFSQGSIVSKFDVFISIILAGVCLAIYIRLTNDAQKFDEKLSNMHITITKEYTHAIDIKMEFLTEVLKNIKESIDALNDSVIEQNKKIFKLASKK